jgi:RNA polymerase sigma-70 factor (ECF subfamily)
MDEKQWLAQKFEGNRAHLRGVAYRMLGSLSEADDAVQETWLRLNRSDTSGVQNLSAWLTTVVAHVCLDMLRSRKSRCEDSEPSAAEPVAPRAAAIDPEQEALLAESVGLALLVVLDTLAPAERLAFVLHDMFDVPFDEIASIVGRSPEAARQLASRARRQVRGGEAAVTADREIHRRIVETFITALRGGDFNALIAILDPDLVARGDAGPAGTPREVRGAEKWAKGAIAYQQAIGRIAPPELMLVDGEIGLVFAPRGKRARALKFRIKDGKITQIEVITQQSRLNQLNLAILTD